MMEPRYTVRSASLNVNSNDTDWVDSSCDTVASVVVMVAMLALGRDVSLLEDRRSQKVRVVMDGKHTTQPNWMKLEDDEAYPVPHYVDIQCRTLSDRLRLLEYVEKSKMARAFRLYRFSMMPDLEGENV